MSSCNLPRKLGYAVCVEELHTTPLITHGYLNTNGVMEYLSISKYTLRAWQNKGILPEPEYNGCSPIWSVDKIKLFVFIKSGRKWYDDTYDTLHAVEITLQSLLYCLNVKNVVVAEGFNRYGVLKDVINLYDWVVERCMREGRMVVSIYYILVKLKLIVNALSLSSIPDTLQYYIKEAVRKLRTTAGE